MNTMMLGVIVALTVPLAGTTLGSALAFFMKKQISTLFQKALLGFAAGSLAALAKVKKPLRGKAAKIAAKQAQKAAQG